MQGAGEPLTDDEVKTMMKEADKDGDGRIDYDGQCCNNPLSANQALLRKYKALKKLF